VKNVRALFEKTVILIGMLLMVLVPAGCKGRAEPIVSTDSNTKQTALSAHSEQAEYLILLVPESGLAKRAAERLQSYIGKTSGRTPKIEQKSIIENKSASTTTIVIGTDSGFTNLSDFDLVDDLAKISGEGYILKTVSKNGSNYILALGKTERGASNAVWHLMRKLDVNNGKVSVPSLSVVRTPFIKGREVTTGPPCIRAGLKYVDMDKLLVEKYSPPCWSEDRLRRNVDLLDSFGYNSIELSDTWIYVDYFEKIGITRKDRSQKTKAVADQLHQNGQTFSLLVYGSSVKDFKTGKEYTRPGACFNDPYERQVLLTEYDYLANTHGSYVDRIVTHWSDLGGQPDCEKCTIKTALEQHNLITEKFKAKNPSVESSFSLWNIIPSIWPGYENDESILDAGILPKDVSISIPGRFNLQRAQHIIEKGYDPSVWCWRTLDIEHWHGLHVHTKLLEDYFKSIPSDIAGKLKFHAVDCLSQFLILSNLYVAGQLMWDPNQSASDLVREYLSGTFGADNTEAMASVYEAIEKGGCYFCPGHQPALAKAMEGSDERLAMLMKAKAQLAKVKISPDFVPVFPTIIEPADMLKEIDAQLGVMIKYSDFQVEAKKLMAYYPELMSMGDTEGIKNAFEALPKVPAPTEYLWTNTHSRYMVDYKALQKELGLF